MTGSPKEATHEERQRDLWKERWPWSVEGRCKSQKYGGSWWEYDLDRKVLLEEFRNKFPGDPVTKSGGFGLGTINFGSDKVEITQQFAQYLIERIADCEGGLESR